MISWGGMYHTNHVKSLKYQFNNIKLNKYKSQDLKELLVNINVKLINRVN